MAGELRRMLVTAVIVGAFAVEVASCGSSSRNTAANSSQSATTTLPIVATSGTPPANASAPTGGGLPPYTPPPPDAEGNPPCGISAVGWGTFFAETGTPDGTRVVLTKNPMVDSEKWDLPDYFTVVVQTTDGKHHTQDAGISPGQGMGPWDSAAEFDFIFRDIDPADVKKVLLTNKKGTCWVQGNS